jgi:hypothetical protein
MTCNARLYPIDLLSIINGDRVQPEADHTTIADRGGPALSHSMLTVIN